ncbi:MAG TPA: kynureninase [Terriglobales bacterium]
MGAITFETSASFAAEMDARDPLARFRQQFHIPPGSDGSPLVYLCGHSLGLQPKSACAYIDQELEAWARLGVEAHFHGSHPWMPYHRLLTDNMAGIVGAKPLEVVVMNSLTVNLHLMMVSFYRPTPERHKIVVEAGAFPSDQYAFRSQIRFHGFDPRTSLLELTPRPGEASIGREDIDGLLEREGSRIALVLLGGVNYATGQLFDMEAITRAGHAQGCVVGFDLAHAAGNVPLRMHDWGVDFAVWCNYKYLNGGPGCVGGCYVHERHAQAFDLPRFAGWWGHDQESRFLMRSNFHPMPGAEGWQLSNPSIMSMAPLRASLEIFATAGIERLREKSESLTGYLEFLLDQHAPGKFTLLTPREPYRRGAQLSIRIHQGGRRISDRLVEQAAICDWREPDILRVAPVPLYNTYADVHHFANRFFAALS